MDTLLRGLMAPGADIPRPPLAAADPVGSRFSSPQVGEQLGGPGNIAPAQHRGGGGRGQPCSQSSA